MILKAVYEVKIVIILLIIAPLAFFHSSVHLFSLNIFFLRLVCEVIYYLGLRSIT